MKNLNIFLLLFSSIATFANNPNLNYFKKHHKVSASLFENNSSRSANIYPQFIATLDGTDTISKELFFYTPDGRITSTMLYDTANNSLQLFFRESFTYGSNNKVSLYKWFFYESGSIADSGETRYTYTPSNFVKSVRSFSTDGNSYLLEQATKYTYDLNNKIVTVNDTSTPNFGNYTEVKQRIYNGNTLTQVITTGNYGGMGNQTDTTFISYDANNRIKEVIRGDAKRIFTYLGSTQKLTKVEPYIFYNGTWQLPNVIPFASGSYAIFTYNNQENITAYSYGEFGNSSWSDSIQRPPVKQFFYYNTNGEIERISLEDSLIVQYNGNCPESIQRYAINNLGSTPYFSGLTFSNGIFYCSNNLNNIYDEGAANNTMPYKYLNPAFGDEQFVTGKHISAYAYEGNRIVVKCADITGIGEIVDSEHLKLFPNPTSDKLFLDAQQSISEISVYTIDGLLLINIKQPLANTIDVTDLPSGFYIAEIKINDTMLKKKWVKM